MRSILFCVLVALAACGGGAKSSPASTGPGEPAEPTEPTTPGDVTETPQDAELCCCETPSVDPIHEMMPSDACPAQGYCVDADACSPAE